MAIEAGGFRDLTVVARRPEGARVMSLVLAATDGAPLPAFEPGQFLTFRIPGPDGRAIPRNYSLSGDPADPARYRISVRREPGPAIGSTHMHAVASEGTRLQATGPKGRFVLDRTSRRPVILVAEDIGLTPLMAMAHALGADGGRPTLLAHVATTPGEAIFAEELASLAARAPNLTVRRLLVGVAGSVPDGFHGIGPLTADHLRAWLPIGDYEAYLCGPRAFLDATTTTLAGLGLRPERILTESFEPARPAAAASTAPAPAPAPVLADTPPVTFEPAGRTVPWDPACRTLLDFAEANGLAPPFSCRAGICATCRTAVEGPVGYVDEPLEMPEPGYALLCCAVPRGPVTVRL
jgi:ferredoxin-NADP reductase